MFHASLESWTRRSSVSSSRATNVECERLARPRKLRQGFGAIIGSFGRPAVRTWIPAAVAAGLVPGPAVTRAWLRTTP